MIVIAIKWIRIGLLFLAVL